MYCHFRKLYFREGRGADHPAVCNDAHRADSKPALQPFHDRNQALYIGRIARPEFATDRITITVQHHTHHHLLQVGTMIFRMTARADGLAALALEVDRGGVEEHDVQIGE